jgi:hypothetical protein
MGVEIRQRALETIALHAALFREQRLRRVAPPG